MKKLIVVIASLLVAVSAYAQFGVVAGKTETADDAAAETAFLGLHGVEDGTVVVDAEEGVVTLREGLEDLTVIGHAGKLSGFGRGTFR